MSMISLDILGCVVDFGNLIKDRFSTDKKLSILGINSSEDGWRPIPLNRGLYLRFAVAF